MKKSVYHFLLLISLATNAQIGGSTTYNFLRLATSWRVTALGESNVGIIDWDPTTQLSNPASLNPLMHRHAHFSTAVHPGGINYGNLGYVHDFGEPGTYGGGLQYMTFGKIPAADENGNATGGYIAANEFNLYGGGSYRFGKFFAVGTNLKVIYSALGTFRSFGMATDIAATINDTAHGIIASLVAKNIGSELVPYNKGARQAIPFDLQVGLSVGFKDFPVRFHLTFHNLHRWNMRYDNPADRNKENSFGDNSQNKSSKVNVGLDEFFRHFIFGAELNIKKIVYINLSYNHQRRMETIQEARRSLAGVNFGLGVHVKQFTVGIALMPMPLNNTLAHFTLAVNTGGFVKRTIK